MLPDAQPVPHAVTGLLQLIGKTPLVRVTRIDTAGSQLWLKLESANPGGSIKDRIGLSMISAAESAGALRRGAKTKLVEATAGNTGLGLALVSALRGYTLTLVIPDKMSQEKITHLKALGARVITTRSDVGKGHPAYYQDLARVIAEKERAFYVNQFENPANPAAHERTTGPEIWNQVGGRMDAMVCGVGSGGTITGLSRFFARVGPQVEMILADPEGSVLAEYTRTKKIGVAGSWLVEGIGEDFVPPICDLSRVARAYTIPDREAFAIVRELLAREGILAGTSSGVLIAAALRWCRERAEAGKPPGRVVTLVPDSGAKYLSKAYNDPWLADHGMVERTKFGDLRDLVARRASDGGLVSVGPRDPLSVAYARMRATDVSQLPVLDEAGSIVGIVDESDVLVAASSDAGGFAREVADVMSTHVETLPPSAPIAALLPLFEQGKVGVVVDGGELVGLITRVDLINHLRRRVG
ncbi:MAG TPA: pyridoxal-phosphate dependent enzyme [Kofleriaceae bacterium]|nr:pyridoxal-phosphate dependent enzyme [Kofleriaceae bacterium]